MSKLGADQTISAMKQLYRNMYTAREIDRIEHNFTGSGEAAFYMSSAGHESTAALAQHLIPEDWLCCHYRDKALMIARGMGAEDYFLSLFAKDRSFSRGRQMHAIVSHAPSNIVSLGTPVGNNALHAVGIAAAVKENPEKPLVYCSVGDGTTRQGEFIEAVSEAAASRLPVLFVIQDNGIALSTRTSGKTFFSLPGGPASEFHGIEITYTDAYACENLSRVFAEEVAHIRENRGPRIVVLEMARLGSHSNADDHTLYRTEDEISGLHEENDPLSHFRSYLTGKGISADTLEREEREIRDELKSIADRARKADEPKAVVTAAKPYEGRLLDPSAEKRGEQPQNGEKGRTMLEAMREVLRNRLAKDSRVFLFGEDIEDPKGDVFGVTRGLSNDFPGRVVNAPLAESTIMGMSIGMALTGERPVAFIQFADFLPVAFNQIFSELASMYWRTDGSWQVPVIIMVTTGGYRPGLGPYHASSFEAMTAHIPGMDVFMPSTAGDAAGLLNAAFESERPTIFFYPKSLLNDRENVAYSSPASLFVPPGTARFLRRGGDLTLVGYGNTVSLCARAAETLEEAGIECDVIDLRSIMPWDRDAVCSSAGRTGKIIIVHEDNQTCGIGAEVAATVAENAGEGITIRRISRPDTWVPFNLENQLELLPSYKDIVDCAVTLFDGTVTWENTGEEEEGIYTVEAIGTSPSDESVIIITWKIEAGQQIEAGELIAEMEADKAAADLLSPVSGTVSEILVEEGIVVKVGTPLLKVKTEEGSETRTVQKTVHASHEEAVITGIRKLKVPEQNTAEAAARGEIGPVPVALAGVVGKTGSRLINNSYISELCPYWKADEIEKRTGIHSRFWVNEDETALTLAVDVSMELFRKLDMPASEVDVIICATGTPVFHTPSMATLIHNALSDGSDDFIPQAFDINAACSGYLYALQSAWDILQSRPESKILLVTTEVLSPQLETSDPGTVPIFGDGATATLIVGGEAAGEHSNRLHRPVLAAKGEAGDILTIPTDRNDKIFMDGKKVFLEAVKGMVLMLERACAQQGLTPADLDLVVPHQANQRIINAVRQKLKAPAENVFSNIRELGNTSSSTIPLCLETILAENRARTIGFTAFGGGFTFAGGVLEIVSG